MRILICRAIKPTEVPGHEVLTCSAEKVLELVSATPDIDVLVPWDAPITRPILEKGSFGLIHQLGVGLDNVDVAAATQLGIWVANINGARSGNADSVAEQAVFLLLAASRFANQVKKSFQERKTTVPAGVALLGKTACIIGAGDIGGRVACRLAGFGMRLIAVHPREVALPGVRFEKRFAPADLGKAVGEADFVVLCASGDKRNTSLIDSTLLSRFKSGSFFINISRGHLVDEAALLAALNQGHLRGAGLDVLTSEPADPSHPLLNHLNVVATPHVGGHTDLSHQGILRAILANLDRYTRGEKLVDVVNEPVNPRRPLK